jgi:hypothetical protein
MPNITSGAVERLLDGARFFYARSETLSIAIGQLCRRSPNLPRVGHNKQQYA